MKNIFRHVKQLRFFFGIVSLTGGKVERVHHLLVVGREQTLVGHRAAEARLLRTGGPFCGKQRKQIRSSLKVMKNK